MRIRPKKTLMEQAADYVESGLAQLESAVHSARDKAGPMLSDVRDKAGPALADARDKAGPILADARDKAADTLADARDKAAPLLADARDKAADTLSDARDKAAPLIASGAAAASERASSTASLAAEKAAAGRDLAVSKTNELRGKPDPKGGRLKKLLLFTGLLAVAGVVARRLQSRSAEDSWQSSYTPAPAPVPSPSSSDTPIFDAAQAASDDEADAVESYDDEAGALPGEALSDSVEEERPITTPDEPAEFVVVDPEALETTESTESANWGDDSSEGSDEDRR